MYGRPLLCKDFDVPTDGSLAIVYPTFGCGLPDPTAGLDGFRKLDALSQNRTQGARRGSGLVEPGFRPSAITSLSFASRSSLDSFPERPVSSAARSAARRRCRGSSPPRRYGRVCSLWRQQRYSDGAAAPRRAGLREKALRPRLAGAWAWSWPSRRAGVPSPPIKIAH
jgi:hypothetical protein